MVSFGFVNVGSKDAGGSSIDKFHGSFDNAGFIFTNKIGNSTPYVMLTLDSIITVQNHLIRIW